MRIPFTTSWYINRLREGTYSQQLEAIEVLSNRINPKNQEEILTEFWNLLKIKLGGNHAYQGLIEHNLIEALSFYGKEDYTQLEFLLTTSDFNQKLNRFNRRKREVIQVQFLVALLRKRINGISGYKRLPINSYVCRWLLFALELAKQGYDFDIEFVQQAGHKVIYTPGEYEQLGYWIHKGDMYGTQENIEDEPFFVSTGQREITPEREEDVYEVPERLELVKGNQLEEPIRSLFLE